MAIGHLVSVWYIFPRFGILNKEKSGNPVSDVKAFLDVKAESSLLVFAPRSFLTDWMR
jgi:hypothetical protein